MLANAQFIALAHTLMPKLIAVAEEAHLLVERLTQMAVHESHYAAIASSLEALN